MHTGFRPWTLLLLALVPSSASALEAVRLDPDQILQAASRWTVAIHVDREPERPNVPRRRGRSLFKTPRILQEYNSRPTGPVTGLLLDAAGHVLTTHYNLSGSPKSIEVTLPGGARRPAKFLASDGSDDLALLKIESMPEGLDVPPIAWGKKDDLRVGRFVLVVGRAPDPERPTATLGIVSALGRNGGRAFQTDAELNYGNVGGPIVALDGSIVGLASFVGHTYPWGLNSGIGFGTTAETIQSVLPRLRQGEDIAAPRRAFLGVGPAEQAIMAGEGVRLGDVSKDSPAEQGGLRVDDVVLSIEKEAVSDFVALRRAINRRQPGDEVEIEVLRGTEKILIKLRLGSRPE